MTKYPFQTKNCFGALDLMPSWIDELYSFGVSPPHYPLSTWLTLSKRSAASDEQPRIHSLDVAVKVDICCVPGASGKYCLRLSPLILVSLSLTHAHTCCLIVCFFMSALQEVCWIHCISIPPCTPKSIQHLTGKRCSCSICSHAFSEISACCPCSRHPSHISLMFIRGDPANH